MRDIEFMADTSDMSVINATNATKFAPSFNCQGCCTIGNKKSHLATALQKVENKFNKNTTQYFYLYVIIVLQKVEKELDNNTNIWY